MEKILVFEDTAAFEAQKERLQYAAFDYKKVIAEYNALGLGPLVPDELPALIIDTQSFVEGKCLDKIPEANPIGGFKVKRSALLDTLELPNIYALQTAIDNTKKWQGAPLQAFDVTKDGSVSIKPEWLQTLRESVRTYATTAHEQDAYRKYRAYMDAFIELDEYMKAHNIYSGLAHVPLNTVMARDTNSQFIVNLQFYQNLIKH